ncbi:hypothetical protein H0H93_007412 [Arthromyces matolae]|nr:hypothetical protein H0H93_007412 [Arthromyces matolae]
MLRYLLQNGSARDTLSIWISQKRRDIRREDASFIVETQDCMQAIVCTADVLVDAVEKHNNRFAVEPTEWDKERDRRKVKKPLVPSHSNAPIAGNPGGSSVQMAGSGLLLPLGLEESTILRIGVPLSKHQDGVQSFNDIMLMIRSLIPRDDKRSRIYIRGWISQKRQEIAREDHEFVVEGAKNRSEVNCTVQDLLNAIQVHNEHFAIPPKEWSRLEGRRNKPGPVHGSGQSPHTQPRNQYDQEMLTKLMPAPTNMQPQGPPSGSSGSGSGFGLQHHHPGQSHLPHDGPQ